MDATRKICAACGKRFTHIGWFNKVKAYVWLMFVPYGILLLWVGGGWCQYVGGVLLPLLGIWVYFIKEQEWKHFEPTTAWNRCPSCKRAGVDEGSPGGMELVERWYPRGEKTNP